MTLKLKTINVQGLTFQYIFYGENKNPKTSVDGLVIPVNKQTKEMLNTSGGFYKELLAPLNDETKRIIVLNVTSIGMKTVTAFFFENKKNIQTSWTLGLMNQK